ncbi:MAG: hypothetical protein IKM21_01375 [Oscillospiraceae bacterium]|nr:hypothetical protein [Oscillospiraceae bacterium]
MNKKAFFFIDDVIWVFRDLTRNRPNSMFDHPFLKIFKDSHEKYGLKVQFNIFYSTDTYYGNDIFTLAEMTDAYKKEWEDAASWLKLAFHSRKEFPDYPYINASYQDVYDDFKMVEKEVFRFASEKNLAKATTPHWRPISREACLAIRDCGIKLLSATYGRKIEYNNDPSSLPYGHAARLLCNRKPETAIFIRETKDAAITKSLCGYNHITEEQRNLTRDNADVICDEKTGLYFKDLLGNGVVLNLLRDDNLIEAMTPHMDIAFYCYGSHEQYFYPEYFAYQPDYENKVMMSAKLLSENGYEFIFAEDLV